MKKYKNKYRIPSARLTYWNYTNNGAYFITICTKNKKHFFGEIIKTPDQSSTDLALQSRTDVAVRQLRTDVAVQRLYPSKKTKLINTMQLNEIGQLAHNYWNEIPDHFPHVQLGNFVIMPNHMHGILIINTSITTETLQCKSAETLHCNVSTEPGKMKNEKMSKISPKSGSIPTIIRSYKSEVTKKARKINSDFAWQTRFHDHIIRNQKSFNNIQNYITKNPENWKNNQQTS